MGKWFPWPGLPPHCIRIPIAAKGHILCRLPFRAAGHSGRWNYLCSRMDCKALALAWKTVFCSRNCCCSCSLCLVCPSCCQKAFGCRAFGNFRNAGSCYSYLYFLSFDFSFGTADKSTSQIIPIIIGSSLCTFSVIGIIFGANSYICRTTE